MPIPSVARRWQDEALNQRPGLINYLIHYQKLCVRGKRTNWLGFFKNHGCAASAPNTHKLKSETDFPRKDKAPHYLDSRGLLEQLKTKARVHLRVLQAMSTLK